MRRTSIEYRQIAQVSSAPVIHAGRYGTCGNSAKASASKVQGRLASSEPSVPRALAIGIFQPEERQRLQALAAVGLAVRRRERLTGEPQAIVLPCPVGIDNPAREDG